MSLAGSGRNITNSFAYKAKKGGNYTYLLLSQNESFTDKDSTEEIIWLNWFFGAINNYSIQTTVNNYDIGFNNNNLFTYRKLQINNDSFSLNPNNILLNISRKLQTTTSFFNNTFNDSNLIYFHISPVLSTIVGNFVLNGDNVILTKQLRTITTVTSFNNNTTNSNLKTDRKLNTTNNNFTTDFINTLLTKGYNVQTNNGNFYLTGENINFKRPNRTILINGSNFTLTGNSVNLDIRAIINGPSAGKLKMWNGIEWVVVTNIKMWT